MRDIYLALFHGMQPEVSILSIVAFSLVCSLRLFWLFRRLSVNLTSFDVFLFVLRLRGWHDTARRGRGGERRAGDGERGGRAVQPPHSCGQDQHRPRSHAKGGSKRCSVAAAASGYRMWRKIPRFS